MPLIYRKIYRDKIEANINLLVVPDNIWYQTKRRRITIDLMEDSKLTYILSFYLIASQYTPSRSISLLRAR